jgi:hypothetical protein
MLAVPRVPPADLIAEAPLEPREEEFDADDTDEL